MTGKPLALRLTLLSMIWVLLALLGTSYVLARQYRHHIEEHFDAHVMTHVEELVAAAETGPDGAVRLARQPTDPRFYRADSGWYWLVLQGEEPVAQSVSLEGQRLDLSGLRTEENHGVQTLSGPGGQQLRAHVMHVSYPHNPGSLTFLATAPEMQITDDVQDFFTHIMQYFALLGVGLMIAVIAQVHIALKPLRAIRTAIQGIRTGELSRLPGNFPSDVQPLVDEMNYLLDHNKTVLKRARTQLSDLAHAVKNPLTIIRNEARELSGKEGQLILDQSHVMASSIDHCLSRARIFGTADALGYRTSVRMVLKDLLYAVEQIHKDRDVDVELLCMEDRWFRGEAQDLEEMVGNLLDNACKWARSRVTVVCQGSDGQLEILIEDDGPGIPEEELATITRRGRKLDERVPGHGQGLGIAQDIAGLYGGKLELGPGEALGGLRARLSLPAA